MTCPKCGNETQRTWRVCPFCEYPVGKIPKPDSPRMKAEESMCNGALDPRSVPTEFQAAAVDDQFECPYCEGTGKRPCTACRNGIPVFSTALCPITPCTDCGDTGWTRWECAECQGTGRLSRKLWGLGKCTWCGGAGQTKCLRCVGTGDGLVLEPPHRIPCDWCHGTGSLSCRPCHGTGKAPVPRHIPMNDPRL